MKPGAQLRIRAGTIFIRRQSCAILHGQQLPLDQLKQFAIGTGLAWCRTGRLFRRRFGTPPSALVPHARQDDRDLHA